MCTRGFIPIYIEYRGKLKHKPRCNIILLYCNV